MPIRLEAETLHHALARLEEWDRDAAVAARASLSWLGWDDEGPLHRENFAHVASTPSGSSPSW